MSDTPIQRLLDSAEWRPLAKKIHHCGTDIPVATHEGLLTIGEQVLRVYQLSNGQRVIEESDLLAFFGVDSMAELLSPIQEPPCQPHE